MKVLFEKIDLKKKPRRIDLVIPEGCLWQPGPQFFLGDRNINMQLGTEGPQYVNVKVTILASDGGSNVKKKSKSR